MKRIYGLVILFGLLAAYALPAVAAPEPTTAVIEQMSSTQSCRSIQIGTTATSVVVSTSPAYRYVSVTNIDPTYDINCSGDVTVSTIAARTDTGFTVTHGSPGDTVVWILVPAQQWYCRTQSTSSTWAHICRGR